MKEDQIKINQEIELKNFSYYFLVQNKRFLNLLFDEKRKRCRNRIVITSSDEFDLKRELNSSQYLAKTHPDSKVICLVVAMPDKTDENLLNMKSIDFSNIEDNFIFIDALKLCPDMDEIREYAWNMACVECLEEGEEDQADEYTEKAFDALKGWIYRLRNSKITVYEKNKEPYVSDSFDSFMETLFQQQMKEYPYSPETMGFLDEMYENHRFRDLAKAGFYQEKNPELEEEGMPAKVFEKFWGHDEAWDDPANENEKLVVLYKAAVSYINEKLSSEGKASFLKLFKHLMGKPYGLLSIRASAVIMGMILRKLPKEGLLYSNGLHYDEPKDEYLINNINNILINSRSDNPNYQEEFLVKKNDSFNCFIENTEKAFGIKSEDTFIIHLLSSLRQKLEEYPYPLYVLKYADISDRLRETIDLYMNFVRTNSSDDSETASKLNELFTQDEELADQLRSILNDQMFTEGVNKLLEMNQIDSDKKIENRYNEWKWIWKEETFLETLRNKK